MRRVYDGPILMTAYPSDIVKQAVVDNLFAYQDASAWISKPINSSELAEKIDRFLLSKHRLERRFMAGFITQLIGKAAGRPVYQLLGGAYHQAVDYFGFVQGDSADELAQHASQLAEAGYSVIYLKIGRGEQKDLENTAAVRAAIGDRKLRLDANEAWDPRTAIYMIKRLAQFQPEFIEQPTPAGSLAALRQVKEAVDVPVAADQSVFSLFDVYEVCRQQAADLIVLSFHETGGLLSFKKAAAIAQSAGISICLHGQSVTGMTDCAQHQIALTIPNLADGNQIMHQLLAEDIIKAPDLTSHHGKINVINDRPGLGFELNWEAVERMVDHYRSNSHFHHS
jgi:muconate cycloisomerase